MLFATPALSLYGTALGLPCPRKGCRRLGPAKPGHLGPRSLSDVSVPERLLRSAASLSFLEESTVPCPRGDRPEVEGAEKSTSVLGRSQETCPCFKCTSCISKDDFPESEICYVLAFER